MPRRASNQVGGNRPHTIQTDSVAEARAQFMHLRHEKSGVLCPCCDKVGHVYRRSISRKLARFLIAILQAHHDTNKDWLYISERDGSDMRAPAGGDYAKLRWWGLVAHLEEIREDGSPRSGRWQITEKGVGFLQGTVRLPKYVYEYDGKPIPLPPYADPIMIGIQDVLDDFSYQRIFP